MGKNEIQNANFIDNSLKMMWHVDKGKVIILSTYIEEDANSKKATKMINKYAKTFC